MDPASEWYSAWVHAIICAISHNIGLSYNGTRLYISQFLWDVITHLYPNFTFGSVKPPLKLSMGDNHISQFHVIIYSLQQKCCHVDEKFITACMRCCQNDHFRCSQWKFHQKDNIAVSVLFNSLFMPSSPKCWFCCFVSVKSAHTSLYIWLLMIACQLMPCFPTQPSISGWDGSCDTCHTSSWMDWNIVTLIKYRILEIHNHT